MTTVNSIIQHAMKKVSSIHEMQTYAMKLKQENKSIGFVPTMGYLHEGHRALIKKAREENDIVILSIFVNPLQFDSKDDLMFYPRDFNRDEAIALEDGVDYLFHPEVGEMYPTEPSVTVKVQKRTDVLCGSKRPGHFDGVATVLTKLFQIVQPDRAYFGKKDAQQVAVVDGLIRDFHFPVTLVPVETIREEDGLAKSSRNVNLLPNERKQAVALYQSLANAKDIVEAGERNPVAIKEMIKNEIKDKCDGIIDYVEIYSYPELEPIDNLKSCFIIAVAVKFTRARLIDNIILTIS